MQYERNFAIYYVPYPEGLYGAQVEALNEELEFVQRQQAAAQAVLREATAATKQRSEFTLEEVPRPLSLQNILFCSAITVSSHQNLRSDTYSILQIHNLVAIAWPRRDELYSLTTLSSFLHCPLPTHNEGPGLSPVSYIDHHPLPLAAQWPRISSGGTGPKATLN